VKFATDCSRVLLVFPRELRSCALTNEDGYLDWRHDMDPVHLDLSKFECIVEAEYSDETGDSITMACKLKGKRVVCLVDPSSDSIDMRQSIRYGTVTPQMQLKFSKSKQ